MRTKTAAGTTICRTATIDQLPMSRAEGLPRCKADAKTGPALRRFKSDHRLGVHCAHNWRAGLDPLGRPAADGGDRARLDVATETVVAGRTVARSCAHHHAAGLPGDRRYPSPRHDGAAGGAERPYGALGCGPRLRAGDRPGGHAGQAEALWDNEDVRTASWRQTGVTKANATRTSTREARTSRPAASDDDATH